MAGRGFWLWRVPDEPRNWIQVILWWELRRIPYNVVLVLAGVTSGVIFFWLARAGPHVFAALLAFLGANLCYTGGWITELLVRAGGGQNYRRFGPRALKAGLAFSLAIVFLPNLTTLAVLLITGENPSPFARFTRTRPHFDDLAGRYVLIEESARLIGMEGISPDAAPSITLSTDSSLFMENMPRLNGGASLSTYDELAEAPRCNLAGRWELLQSADERTWEVWVDFQDIECLGVRPEWFRPYTTGYNLQDNAPPYRICIIVGDPDNWDFLIFEQAT